MQKPSAHKFLLIDAVGALVSSFILLVVLVSVEGKIGLPVEVLYVLGGLAVLFSIYSFSSYLWVKQNWAPYLKTIAMVNLMYCMLTAGVIFYFRNSLTNLGFVYFIVEIIIVVSLSIFELNVANKREEL